MAELEKKQVNVLTVKNKLMSIYNLWACVFCQTEIIYIATGKKKKKSNAKCITLLYIKCSFMDPGLINCK